MFKCILDTSPTHTPQAYYFDGTEVLSDTDFDQLKEDLTWAGRWSVGRSVGVGVIVVGVLWSVGRWVWVL